MGRGSESSAAVWLLAVSTVVAWLCGVFFLAWALARSWLRS